MSAGDSATVQDPPVGPVKGRGPTFITRFLESRHLGWAGLAIGLVMIDKAVAPAAPEAVIVTTVGAWDKKLMDDGSVIYAGPRTELAFHRDGGMVPVMRGAVGAPVVVEAI